MELRDYARVLIRYWWLIVLLVVVVGVGSFIFRSQPAPQYFTGYDPILTSYQASEYIRDDFVEIIQSDVFADDVNAMLKKMGVNDVTIGRGNLGAAIEKQR